MSKTTISLFIILLLSVGALAFVAYDKQQNQFITSLTKPLISRLSPARVTLSFLTGEQTVRPGQTVTLAVMIHDPQPHPTVVQVEIGYDPSAITVDSISPGTFFTKPVVALQNIDPVAGRISYALRCPNQQNSDQAVDCVNSSSSSVAMVTISINPYTIQNATSLSFFPKTAIRTASGRDLLKKTNGEQLTITRLLYPVSSSSGMIKPLVKSSIPATSAAH
jgi:hypothetical protein